MLNERLARFDFDLTPASAGPFVAIPYVAIHVNALLPQKLCDVTDANLLLCAALWQVVSKQSAAILCRAISSFLRGGFFFRLLLLRHSTAFFRLGDHRDDARG